MDARQFRAKTAKYPENASHTCYSVMQMRKANREKDYSFILPPTGWEPILRLRNSSGTRCCSSNFWVTYQCSNSKIDYYF